MTRCWPSPSWIDLLHHATTINIKGDSYRLREEKKAGLLGRKPPTTEPEMVPTATWPMGQECR